MCFRNFRALIVNFNIMKRISLLIFVLLTYLGGYSQNLQPEGFEGTDFPPPGWARFQNEVGLVPIWQKNPPNNSNRPAHTGTGAAFIDRQNISGTISPVDYLATPAFTVPANPQLRFWSRLTTSGDQGTIYRIMIKFANGTNGPQNDPAGYVQIQQWTELEINPINQEEYAQKIVSIPAEYVNQQVYVAFVIINTNNGDRWLVDDVDVITECVAPTDLASSNFGLTTADLAWANPAGAASFEIEIKQQAAAFTGTGLETSTSTTFTAQSLTPDTAYKFRVRAVCGPNNVSAWSTPGNFNTVALGESCNAPIVVTLPYSTTDNTSNYADANYEGSPGAGCGTTSNYLGGNDVVYAYTADIDGTISIDLTGNDTWTGLFVYNSCANIGVSCIAGDTGTGISIPTLSVTAGTTYYIVISTWPSPQTTAYNLIIQAVNCPSPTNLTAGNISATSAALSWDANGSSSWEVVVQTPGSGIPQGAGTTANTNSNYTVTQTTAGVPLIPSTPYEYYVRAACPGSSLFSAWSGPFAFMTTQIALPIPYTQDFETVPSGFSLINGAQENQWVVGTAVNNGGTTSLYVSNDNGLSNQYSSNTFNSTTIHAFRDIQMPSGVDQVSVSFDWRAVGESGFFGNFDFLRVWAVPASFVPIAGNQITAGDGRVQLGGDLLNSPDWQTFNGVLNAAGFAGQVVRIVFEWRNDGFGVSQPPAAIDNVNIDVITCSAPSAVTLGNITNSTANITWTAPVSGAASYDYYLSATNTAPTSATAPTGNVTATNAALTGLTDSTTYYFWVRSNCGANGTSFWIGPLEFMTTQVAIAIPYTQDFETAPSGFTLINGNEENKWVVGTAVNNGGTTSLYVSNDNGVSNQYSSNTFDASVVHAYRDIQMPSGVDQVSVSFDWRAVGEGFFFGNSDFLRVWAVPASFVPTAGNQITAGNNRVQLGNDFLNNPDWQTFNGVLNASGFAGQVVRIVFEWRNDGFGVNQPPAAIDNINISVITCSAPSALTLGTVGETTANITWTAPASGAAGYDYYLTTSNTPPTATTTPTTVNTPGTTAALTGLLNSTAYNFWVRSNCGDANGVSFWVGPLSFNTTQVAAALPFTQDFEGVSSGFTLNNGTQGNKWVVGTATSNGGTQSLYISQDNGISNTYNVSSTSTVHAYRDIAIPANTTDVSLSFDWKAVGEGGIFSTFDYLRVWAVPVTFSPTPGTQIQTAADRIQISPQLLNNPNFVTQTYIFNASGYSGNSMRLVFEWVNDFTIGNQPPAAIDNIALAIVTCPQPAALAVTGVTPSQATLTWDEQGTATAWEVFVTTPGSPAPTAATAGDAATAETFTATETTAGVAFTGVTNYVFYVRAICSDSDKSLWSGPFAFQTSIGNNECAGAATVPVNPTVACTETTPVGFTGATASADANTCNGPNGADVWYEFTATNNAHGISLDNFTGAINPIGLALYEGDECGSLIQLACSYNNVINATNLVPGTVYKVRIYINQANPVLTTGMTLCINTPPPPVNIDGDAACVINTINSSFEQPVIANASLEFINHSEVQGWRTTAIDQTIEYWSSGMQGVPASEGNQFIELNANFVSGIYQDYNTAQSTAFTYSFDHRGRNVGNNPNTGPDVIQLMAGPPGGPYENVGPPRSTTAAQWITYEGTYTSPEGQPVTRFIFQSVSSGSGDNSIGNFLDAIVFTSNSQILSVNPANLNCTNNIANVQAAGTGTWIARSDNPAPTTIANANNNTTTISGFTTPGVYRYEWTTTTCVSTLVINYDGTAVAAPVVTSPVEYCTGQAATPLTATQEGSNILNWYTTETGGTPSATAPTPSTVTATAPVGITYYVSQTSANGCESPRAPVTVIVYDTPPAPAVTPVTYCQDATATPLTATGSAGATLNWYTQPTGGTALATAPTPDTAQPGQTSYYVSQTLAAGCEGTRAELIVTVNASVIPVTAISLPSALCIATGGSITPVPLGTALTPGGTFTASPSLIINSTTGEIDVTSATAGTQYTITYTILPDSNTCNPGGNSSATITFTPLTQPAIVLSYPAQVCANAANQTISPNAGFTPGGTFSVDGGLTVNTQGVVDLANAVAGTTYTVTYAFAQDNSACTAAAQQQATFTVTTAITPVVQFDYDAAYCYDSQNAGPDKENGFTTGGVFTATPEGLNIDPATGVINFEASTAGTYTVTYTVQPDAATCNSGGSFSDTFTINGNIDFTLEGSCDGNVFNVTATPVDNSYNPETVTYSWRTANGQAIGNNSNVLNVTDFAGAGNVTFPAELTLLVTNNGCVTSKSITVTDIGCTIQKGISPNNDSLNDNFELTSLGVRHLSIFNRYGVEVYSLRNYTNQWHGQTNSGDELPTGTYYYMIDRNNGQQHTGWIYINREE